MVSLKNTSDSIIWLRIMHVIWIVIRGNGNFVAIDLFHLGQSESSTVIRHLRDCCIPLSQHWRVESAIF